MPWHTVVARILKFPERLNSSSGIEAYKRGDEISEFVSYIKFPKERKQIWRIKNFKLKFKSTERLEQKKLRR